MIYTDNYLDVCDCEHRWSIYPYTSSRSIGSLTIYVCNNCLSVKVVQKVDQFDGKCCTGQKVTTTIVEPSEDGVFEEYEFK